MPLEPRQMWILMLIGRLREGEGEDKDEGRERGLNHGGGLTHSLIYSFADLLFTGSLTYSQSHWV